MTPARNFALCTLFIGTILSGCTTTTHDILLSDAIPKNYEALVTRTEQEIKRAADKGYLWLNTETYLTEAREAHAAGDIDKAMQLAQKALTEALLAQKQAAEGARAKADFVHRR